MQEIMHESPIVIRGESPIREFQDMKQAYDCLQEWKERLFLQDWIIKLKLCTPDEMEIKNCSGYNNFQIENKCAVISILKPEYYGDRIIKYCAEEILVHELLHCKYNWVERNYDSIEVAYYDVLEHSLIEQMAKSLIMAKYNLKLDWFRNFDLPDDSIKGGN